MTGSSDADRIRMESQRHRISWDADDFRRTMLVLAKDAEHRRIPAPKRPDFVRLDTWEPFFGELWQLTDTTGREHGRVILADLDKGSIVMGKKYVGEKSMVAIGTHRQPSRESVQHIVGMMHSHPNAPDHLSSVFSDEDYAGFLSLESCQFSIVQYGRHDALLVMKTGSTPSLTYERATEWVSRLFQESVAVHGALGLEAMIEFNKLVCIEMQLTLYRMSPESGGVFRRIEVTR